jgi:L,D-peptidoglycan transpeptidase YkuD (ErfK/YbiS/YcfS/YnhG family)
MLLFLSDPFLHVSANCSKLLLALGVVAVSSCCAGRPGIVLTKLEEESRSSKGLYTTSFDFKQPELSKLAALEWRETRRNQDQPSMLWASLLCFAKEEKTIRRPNRSLHHQ